MGKIGTRNFLVTALTVVICIMVLCSLLLVQLYQYSAREKFQSLETDGNSLTGLAYIWQTTPYRLDTTAMRDVLTKQADLNNTRILVTDAFGNIKIYADPSGSGENAGALPAGVLEKIAAQTVYKEVGTLNGYYRNRILNVGLAISDPAGNFRGAVIVSAPANSITIMFRSFMRGVAVITLFVLVLAAAITFFVAQRTTRPLKDMAAASRSFAMGNFTARVAVTGRDEISELARSFNSMADSMEQLERLRSEFIANVSHELKTPMTTIGGFIDGILDGTIPPDRQEHYLTIVSSEIHRLSRMVARLLLATRLQSGQQDLNITTLDISAVISTAIVNAEQSIEAKGLNVDVDLPETRCYVRGDSDALAQVVNNLVDNAVKYSNDGGRMAVSVREHGDSVYVSVFNTGVGIAPEQLSHVFDRFYKADRSRGMDKNSTGLGLYIVKAILNNLHQTITAESEYGQWARFTFTLDAVRHPDRAVPPEEL